MHPTPEMAARENAHVARQIQIQNILRRELLTGGEALLKDVFEDSNLKLELEDVRTGEVETEVETATKEALEERMGWVKEIVEESFADASGDLKETEALLLGRLGVR